ncbi:hypothetical protein CEQ90_16115 [Lewinellaceae bacterium SD302]|nr:hypothetical protein CEQ90_16115 [Lewinellaceae bacterium SD302]
MQIDTFLTAFANPRFLFLLLIPAFFSCGGPEERLVPEVNPDIIELEVLRFERELMNGDTSKLATLLNELTDNYPDFTDVYFRYAIPLKRGDFSPEEQVDILKAFITYPLTQEVFRYTEDNFSDYQSSKADRQAGQASLAELKQALAFYHYYLPDVPLPDTLVTFISQFQFAGFQFGDDQLAVGLDMFIGPDFDYASVSATETIFSDYLARTYTPEHLTSKMMQLLIDEQVPTPDEGRLIDYMVANGKKLYLLDLVLPYSPDSIKLEMTAEQVEWLNDNETQIYVYLQSQDLLYETDLRKYRKYIDPSPNSPGMPTGAPGRSANWLGMQIVDAWIRNHPNADVVDLLQISDGQRILAESKFKPR